MSAYNLLINEKFIQDMYEQASTSPRLRSHHLIHKSHADAVQRMCIAMIAGTFVRPHRHPQSTKWELLVPIKGQTGLLLFDDHGRVTERITLDTRDGMAGVELKPGTWHTIFPLTDQAFIIEVKQGPFEPMQQHDFVEWAPEEGDVNVSALVEWYMSAKAGDKYTQTK